MNSYRDPRPRIIGLLAVTFGSHEIDGRIKSSEIHQGHDIHAFYRLGKDHSKVIHVQGYLGLSNEREMHVWARLMNYQKMQEIRSTRKVSIGNEHEAVIKNFPNFGNGVRIAYNPDVLESMIAENVEELK